MVRIKNSPPAKKQTPLKGINSKRDSSIDAKIKRQSKRKSFVPRRRTIVDQQKEGMMILNFGKLENIHKRTFNEMKFLQKTTHNLIPKLSFSRLVREIIQDQAGNAVHVQSSALVALQEAAEHHIIDLFEACNLLCYHAKRKTVRVNDMTLARRLLNWQTHKYIH